MYFIIHTNGGKSIKKIGLVSNSPKFGIRANSRYTPAIMELRTLLELDADLSQRIRLDGSHSLLKKVAAFLAHSGDSWFWAAGLGLVWLFATNEWHAKAALLITGIVGLAITVLVIKFSIRRRRPKGEWGAIYRITDPHSFPSGHAARAFMLALLAIFMGPAWFGMLVLIWAPLVSLARVAMGLHFLSDVIAGMVVGLIAGLFMLWISPLLIGWFPFIF